MTPGMQSIIAAVQEGWLELACLAFASYGYCAWLNRKLWGEKA